MLLCIRLANYKISLVFNKEIIDDCNTVGSERKQWEEEDGDEEEDADNDDVDADVERVEVEVDRCENDTKWLDRLACMGAANGYNAQYVDRAECVSSNLPSSSSYLL